MTEPIEMKTCRACGEPKPITAFYKGVRRGQKQYYLPDCIVCLGPIRAAQRLVKMVDPAERDKERKRMQANRAKRKITHPEDKDKARERRARQKALIEADPERKAAELAKQRARRVVRMADPAKREAVNQKQRGYRLDPVKRAKHTAAVMAWQRRNPDKARAARRKYRTAKRAAAKAAKAA